MTITTTILNNLRVKSRDKEIIRLKQRIKKLHAGLKKLHLQSLYQETEKDKRDNYLPYELFEEIESLIYKHP